MTANVTKFREQVLKEIDETPIEHPPHLAQLIRIFRESISLRSAKESLDQGWLEASRGETRPISDLWEGIDAE